MRGSEWEGWRAHTTATRDRFAGVTALPITNYRNVVGSRPPHEAISDVIQRYDLTYAAFAHGTLGHPIDKTRRFALRQRVGAAAAHQAHAARAVAAHAGQDHPDAARAQRCNRPEQYIG